MFFICYRQCTIFVSFCIIIVKRRPVQMPALYSVGAGADSRNQAYQRVVVSKRIYCPESVRNL